MESPLQPPPPSFAFCPEERFSRSEDVFSPPSFPLTFSLSSPPSLFSLYLFLFFLLISFFFLCFSCAIFPSPAISDHEDRAGGVGRGTGWCGQHTQRPKSHQDQRASGLSSLGRALVLLLRPSARIFPQLASLHGNTLLCSLPKPAGEGEWPNRYPALLQGYEGPPDSVACLGHRVSAHRSGLSSPCPRSCVGPGEGCGMGSERS